MILRKSWITSVWYWREVIFNVWIPLLPGIGLWLPLGTSWYFNFLDSISSINSFENSLSIQCRIGLMPAFFSVPYISMNSSNRYSFFMTWLPLLVLVPCHYPSLPLYIYICFVVLMLLEILLLGCSMLFLLGLQILLQLLIQYVHNFLFVLVVGNLLMGPLLDFPLFLLLLLLMSVKDSLLLCAYGPLLCVLILENICGCRFLLVLGRM